MLRIFTLVIFKSCELGYVPLDEKTKQNNVLSCVISGNPEVASRANATISPEAEIVLYHVISTIWIGCWNP